MRAEEEEEAAVVAVDLLPTPGSHSYTLSVSFALVCAHSLPASLLFLSEMTPLLGALQACCRGDRSKGVDESMSTITFFFSPPPNSVPPPICASPLDHSPPSAPHDICHPFVASRALRRKVLHIRSIFCHFFINR